MFLGWYTDGPVYTLFDGQLCIVSIDVPDTMSSVSGNAALSGLD